MVFLMIRKQVRLDLIIDFSQYCYAFYRNDIPSNCYGQWSVMKVKISGWCYVLTRHHVTHYLFPSNTHTFSFFLTLTLTLTFTFNITILHSVYTLISHNNYWYSTFSLKERWMMPWVMQSIDTRVVNRSNALSQWGYGRNLIYREFMAAPNMFAAIFTSAIFPLIGSLLFFSFTRYDNLLLFFFLFICPCMCSDRLEINFFLFLYRNEYTH